MLASVDQQFDDLAGLVLNATWKFYPDWASKEGLHEYDGGITDISSSSVSARVRDLETYLALLHRLDEGLLSENRRFDRRILVSALRQEKFRLTELAIYRRNPMDALRHVDMSNYILRNYAPAHERVEVLTAALAMVPEYLATLRSGLDEGIGAPVVEAGIEAYEGMRTFYDTELTAHVRQLADQEAFGRFNAARRAASRALLSFVTHLRAVLNTSPPDFAIGATNFRWLLENGEMVDLPIDHLERMGEQDLHRNLIKLRKLAAEVTHGSDVASLLREARRNHPGASMLTAETRRILEEVQQFVVENDLISIPSTLPCVVRETPAFMRWAFATIDLPGIFETTDDEAYYYVTPVDASWTEGQKDEWLSSFNYPLLKNMSMHEVYPGHYVHYLHFRNAMSKMSLIFGAYSFWEGWAHYAEEMMIEQGFAWNDKRVHAMQLAEALLRDCRFLCAIRMHTQGMTVAEAKLFFMEHAYLERLPAEREALRGTFDPMYLAYTLGKIQIKKLLEEYKARTKHGFTLKTFHDVLLSFGAPPVPLVREAMLGELSEPPL